MFNIPTVTKRLLIANIVAFLATFVLQGMGLDLNGLFGLHFFLAHDFEIYQLFTYMFMHGGWSHLFFNMFALWMFGCIVERTWGPRKFLLYYLICGVGAGLFQEMAQFVQLCLMASEQLPGFRLSMVFEVARNSQAVLGLWTTVGASGAIYGILLAFGMLYPEERIFIFPLPVPIKAKWFVVLYAAVELVSAVSQSGDGVAHLAHLGGMAFGYYLIRYWNRHPSVGYGRSSGQQFFDSLRSSWERRTHRSASGFGTSGTRRSTSGTQHNTGRSTGNPDWDYNARRAAEQAETDRILDKIRRNGYDSLTREEKQHLFDSSRH